MISSRSLRLAVVSAALLLPASVACQRGRTSPPERPAPIVIAPGPTAPAPAPASAPAPAAWSAATPVGQIVAERPATARVLERAGIDYCCGGTATLSDAARARGLDPAKVLSDLAAVPAAAPSAADERVWTEAPLPELLASIVATHHAYLREELPRLTEIVAKVRVVHREAHPELAGVADTYMELAKALPPHLTLEEESLFPAVRSLSGGERAQAAQTLRWLEEMRSQHDAAGAALHALRERTNGFAVPADACALYRQMLAGFEALEADLHRHVHLENNVLLPRAMALARG